MDNEKHQEYQYLDLMKEILDKGVIKHDHNTGMELKSVFGRQARYDLSKGFPLLTRPFPKLKLLDDFDSLESFKPEHVILDNYNPHPPIKALLTVASGFDEKDRLDSQKKDEDKSC